MDKRGSNAEYLPGGDGETDRYHVIDPIQPMNVTYVFGLDMVTIKVPEKLEPLLSMVAGGDISGITAWDLLLQLAERVSPKTEVTVTIRFDQNVSCGYFQPDRFQRLFPPDVRILGRKQSAHCEVQLHQAEPGHRS